MNQHDAPPNLLVRQASTDWHPPSVQTYGNEAHLRDILAAQPSLIPGVGADAVAVAEFRVPDTGAVDVVAIGAGGDITLCECKLAANPEIRRSVVGQVLAYAAGMWHMRYEDFESRWRSRSGAPIEDVFPGSDQDLRGELTANLERGDFRLVLAVDAITAELRRTVEYLNAHTAPATSIVALELEYAREGDVELLAPRVYGAELANAKREARAHQWSEQELYEAVAAIDPENVDAIRRLLEHFRPRLDRYYFGTGNSPSVTAVLGTEDRSQPFSVWTGDWLGISANFGWMHRMGVEAQRTLYEALASIPGLVASLEGVPESGYTKRPTFRMKGQLDQNDTLDRLIAAFDLVIPER